MNAGFNSAKKDDPLSDPELAETSRGALMEKLQMEWLELSADRVRARIPVEGNTQPFGLLHGGASACLAETLASIGAWLSDTSKVTMGIEVKVNHLRPGTQGWITGVVIPLHKGRNIQVWEIRMSDDDEKLTAFSTVTIAVRERQT